ncbi:MAG: hypothetical protein FWF76_06105 [Oscillospiraceae bacterium]|nr:hypothetical protein [Oscillospiraceae bacterium]
MKKKLQVLLLSVCISMAVNVLGLCLSSSSIVANNDEDYSSTDTELLIPIHFVITDANGNHVESGEFELGYLTQRNFEPLSTTFSIPRNGSLTFRPSGQYGWVVPANWNLVFSYTLGRRALIQQVIHRNTSASLGTVVNNSTAEVSWVRGAFRAPTTANYSLTLHNWSNSALPITVNSVRISQNAPVGWHGAG